MKDALALETVRKTTKSIGILTELAVMARFSAMGYSLNLPYGDDAPYDLIVETPDDRLFRIQIKTGRLRDGVIRFNCVSEHGHRNAPPTRYDGRIDAFAVYCAANDGLYIIDVNDVCVRGSRGWLRIAPPRNNMRHGIHWAADYVIEKGESPKLFRSEPSVTGALGGD